MSQTVCCVPHLSTNLFHHSKVLISLKSLRHCEMLACPARLYPICVRSEARRTRGRLTGQSSEMLEEYDQKEGWVASIKNVLFFPSLHSVMRTAGLLILMSLAY